jgi:hypothetical protein
MSLPRGATMARYFFDWRDNENFDEDDEGMELPDLEAVKVEASRALLERAHDILPGLDRHSLSIEVRDNTGRPLLSIVLILEIRTLAIERPVA